LSPGPPCHAMYKREPNTASEGPKVLAAGAGSRRCPAQLWPSKLLHHRELSPGPPRHAMYKSPLLYAASEGASVLATGAGTCCCGSHERSGVLGAAGSRRVAG